jgi:hypothetical protein
MLSGWMEGRGVMQFRTSVEKGKAFMINELLT